MEMKRKKSMKKVMAVAVAITAPILPSVVNAGTLDPAAAPAPTMRTLEELKPAWNRIIPADQRFVDALDGNAVLDKETGLVWDKSPDTNAVSWHDAMAACFTKRKGERLGWRVPTLDELASLLDTTQMTAPHLPEGNPFSNVQNGSYWTSTVDADDSIYAFRVSTVTGVDAKSIGALKTTSSYVWCVRSGK
jgi:hypothetical protein